MKNLIFIFLFLNSNLMFAQTYYGTNGLGRLELVNDSVYVASFLWIAGGGPITDTGFYKKNNDIIWLFSKIGHPFKIIASDKEQPVESGYSVLLKLYGKDNRSGAYVLGLENCYGIFDTIEKQIVYNDQSIRKDDILVIHNGPCYDRLKWEGNTIRFFTIKYLHPYQNVMRIVFFNGFPLLIKGNKLIPIDGEKIEQCWVDNGFYFPKMKKSKKEKYFKTVARSTLGLQGLPCSKCAPEIQ